MIPSANLKLLFAPYFGVVLTFLAMLAGSWQRWTSMIVDIGRETDLPLRIMNGEVLYRDVHYLYPPFTPYFNAALYWLFGPHLNVLVLSGIACSALLTFICYRLSRRLMAPTAASLAVSFIIVLCFFKPAGNLILSYSFAGVHAAVFSLSSVLFLFRFAEGRKRRDLVITGLLIGMAAITKQEFAFAGAMAASGYLVFLHRSDVKGFVKDLAITAGAGLVIAAPVFGALFATIDSRILIDDCHLFFTNIPESLVAYNRFRSGLDHPFESFAAMIGAAALVAALCSAMVLAAGAAATLRRRATAVLVISGALTGIILVAFFEAWDGSPLRAVPFMLVGLILAEWRRRSRRTAGQADSEIAAKGHFVFILAIYSLAILARVVLRVPSGGFSGSFYLPTSLILIFYLLFHRFPEKVGVWSCDVRFASRIRAIATGIVLLSVLVMGATFLYRYRSRYTYPITAERGNLYAEPHSGPAIDQAMSFIEQNTRPNEFIAVLPEGSDLAFLTARRIDLRHQVLIPDFLSEQDESDAIAAMERDGVRYILVPNRAMNEFGKREFGRDFYVTMGEWIDKNFQVVQIFGLEPGQIAETGKPPFWIKVYQRRK